MKVRVFGLNRETTAFDQVAHLETKGPAQTKALFLLPDNFPGRPPFGEPPAFLESLQDRVVDPLQGLDQDAVAGNRMNELTRRDQLFLPPRQQPIVARIEQINDDPAIGRKMFPHTGHALALRFWRREYLERTEREENKGEFSAQIEPGHVA